MDTLELGQWRGSEGSDQPDGNTPPHYAMLDEEREVGNQQVTHGWSDLERQAQLESEQRKRPEIGYGILFDGECAKQDFTVAVDVGFAPEIERNDLWDAIYDLRAHFEVAVIAWLAIHAPQGTKTSEVLVDDD